MTNIIINKKHIDIIQNAKKIYPSLENLNIKPSGVEQIFNHPNSYGYDEVVVEAVKVKEHYLEGSNLILVLNDNTKLSLDISEYITENLTEEQIKAINNMTVLIENGELIIEYDDEVLNLNFNLENGNLIVDNNVNGLNLNINTNEELEAIY